MTRPRAMWTGRAWSWVLDYVYIGSRQLRTLVARASQEAPAGDRAPVLLVPGVFETSAFLQPLGDLARERGHPVHIVAELGRNRGRVADMADIAQRFLNERDLHGVVIIAHSKGGLIGKHMMVQDDTEKRIDRMVAINTPFGGSRYARYAIPRTIRDFSPRDRTLGMLARNLEVNARITSIYSKFDPHIPGGSFLEGARNIELPVAGHFRPIASRELRDAVREELQRE